MKIGCRNRSKRTIAELQLSYVVVGMSVDQTPLRVIDIEIVSTVGIINAKQRIPGHGRRPRVVGVGRRLSVEILDADQVLITAIVRVGRHAARIVGHGRNPARAVVANQ